MKAQVEMWLFIGHEIEFGILGDEAQELFIEDPNRYLVNGHLGQRHKIPLRVE